MRGDSCSPAATAAAVVACIAPTPAFALHSAVREASAIDARGDWINAPGTSRSGLRVAVHLERRHGVLVGTLAIPDQGALDIPLLQVRAQGVRLSFAVPRASGRFTGSWNARRRAYVGRFTSPYGDHPLGLSRGPLLVDWRASPTPGLTYTPGPAARARTGPTLPIGKCINMSNMLEAPREGDWGPAIADDDFRIIKAAGFSTVRIPVSWSTHAETASPYTVDPAFLRRVHHVVDLATASGVDVILDMHHYNELFAAPQAHAARFAALWRQIAASFASAPPNIWFELLNEPTDKLTDANMTPILAGALRAVRLTNPNRPVLVGGQNWSSLQALNTLSLPDDRYVVPTFHYYEPFAFTNQGAPWRGAPPFGRAYGSAADKLLLDRDLATLRAYMARTGRVPVLGEYGTTDDPRLPLAQRVRYYRTISAAFASIGVQGCAWGYRNASQLWNGRRWLPGLVESISATTTR